MHVMTAYLVVVGGFTATVQVGRGLVRGTGKLIEGEPRAALGEALGGLVAPLREALDQVWRLGEDVGQAAGVIIGSGEEPGDPLPPAPCSRRRRPVPAADAVAS